MAAADVAAADVAAQQPVSAQVVGNAFVQQYYHILHHSPELVYRFYQDTSKLGRPEEDGSMSITTTMQEINDKIVSLKYSDFSAEIKSVDSQESFNGGVSVLVTGYLTGKDNMIRNFSQSFFLAPQDRGYFVLNDMLRYVEFANQDNTIHAPVADTVVPVTVEQDPPSVQENLILEESTPSVEEVNGEEVLNPPENGDVPVVEEEEPVAEVVNEPQEVSQMVVESNTKIEEVPKKSYAKIEEAPKKSYAKIEEVPKKSYAKIVSELKESAATFSLPAPAIRKPVVKNAEKVNQPSAVAADILDSSAPVDNVNNQEEEADGYSIYIKGLPLSATVSLLAEEFKKFGPIKDGGIQVRSNRGFCFGFVEFEEASAVQKAIEASPVAVGGRQVVVEEKRSTTNPRGNNNRRFLSGRGSGFRSEGVRGRGNYGGGRGYNRGEFNSRNEFSNRVGNRGGSSNRGGDGYQRADHAGNNGGRVNRVGGMPPYGTAKDMAPRVSATA
ncbi:PREDICTED: putative G3BP-like protein isoform X3 [Ipomoea nil]|uniref:putative G3BP-like protein isoform X3 n=1 Tax=Ipomoea nil TaxID=35883 RepID=UPI000900D5C1|nr:PREDICTED: putative G3BP-like protein isoform X3 [Ipomoea nil]